MHQKFISVNQQKKLKPAPDALEHIHQQTVDHQLMISESLGEIQKLTHDLGISQIEDNSSSGTELVALSGNVDVDNYGKQLVKAKEITLPALFQKIKDDTEKLTGWMNASTLPIKAQCVGMEKTIEDVDDRIFSISLYAGLVEKTVVCSDGEPAGVHDKVHIIQSMSYMDEECLMDYKTGGMEFKDIEKFDKWISKPKNRDRILPHPKCVVAMRIRRNVKDRHWSGGLISFREIEEGKLSDKFTYLYIRNGEKVSRLITELDFGETLFPPKSLVECNEPLMFKSNSFSSYSFMTKREYEYEKSKRKEIKKKYKKWEKENKKKKKSDRVHYFNNPHRSEYHNSSYIESYEPFDSNSVDYDQGVEDQLKTLKKYNRIALILQGLFDRSEAFQPHPKVKLWDVDQFESMIEFVYLEETAIANGDKPDFEAFRKKCNESLTLGCVTSGQRRYWGEKEAIKENNARARNWRTSEFDQGVGDCYYPYKDENCGPDFVDTPTKVTRGSKRCKFEWERERKVYNPWGSNPPIKCSITVPVDRIFNVSAYKIGDYLQFFNDHRTREEYLEWAYLLLSAEDYHQRLAKEKRSSTKT